MTVGLQSKVTESVQRQFHDILYPHYSFCRGWAAQLMREYAALRTNEAKTPAGVIDSEMIDHCRQH